MNKVNEKGGGKDIVNLSFTWTVFENTDTSGHITVAYIDFTWVDWVVIWSKIRVPKCCVCCENERHHLILPSLGPVFRASAPLCLPSTAPRKVKLHSKSWSFASSSWGTVCSWNLLGLLPCFLSSSGLALKPISDRQLWKGRSNLQYIEESWWPIKIMYMDMLCDLKIAMQIKG